MDQTQMAYESEQDLSQGYTLCVEVLPDGFRVSEPMPLASYSDEENNESEPEEESPESLQPDIASALKQVMAVIQANPVGQSEQAAFHESDAQ